MEWTGGERRTSGAERMKVARPVSIFAGDRTHILRAQTVDLSTGGMRIDLADGLPVGEKILFRIDLGEGFDPAVQGGEVAWSDDGLGAGVRFSPVVPGQEQAEAAPPGPALPAAGEAVKLHIDRMERTLKVQCVDAGDWGISVRTELPFLEKGERIVARFRTADGREGEISGILEEVNLEPDLGDPVPSIRLEILTGSSPRPAPACEEPAGETAQAAEPPSPVEDEATWEPEESTQRDAVPPPVEEARIETVEVAPDDAEDPISDAFGSLTKKAEAEGDSPIEPRYVIVLRAVAAWLLVTGRRLGAATAAYASAAWAALVPWIRRNAPRLAARARLAGRLASSIAERVASRMPSASTTTAIRMRRQKRRTTQISTPASPGPRTLPPLARRALLAAMVLAAVAGFSTGVWGLVSLIRSGKDDAKGQAEQASGVQASKGSFDMWGGSTLPRGTVVEAEISEIDVAQAEAAAPPPAAQPAAPAAPVALQAAPTAQPAPPPPASVPAGPVPGATTENGFYLGVDGEITGYDYYALKSPPGLVVDVKGALPIRDGIQDLSLPGVTKVKAVARESGARFIIYFEGTKIPEFQVLPAGPTLEIRLDS